MARLAAWLIEAVPRGRIAAFRTVVYLFVAADLVYFTPWVRAHANVPGELYRPLLVGRLLHLPTPDHALVMGIFWALLVLALAAATGRAPRALGLAVFVLYFEWMIIAMSYGKVDHDRFAFLVALAVLPTAGRARHGDRTPTERGGWALRVTQLAVVATYFLAAWAKLRFGGPGWMFGSVLMRAIIRRGTALTDLLSAAPGVLIAAQIGIMAFELFSPLIFVLRPRWRYAGVAYFYGFHLITIATITISFAPHLVALTSFLPLERVRPIAWLARGLHRLRGARLERGPLGGGQGAGGGTAGHPIAVPGDPAVHGPGNGQHGPAVEQPAQPAPEPA
jgi:hypothetical protein